MSEIEIYTIINAGLYIRVGETRLMVDGINTTTDCFDGISQATFESMMHNQDFFQDCDYLLYTHFHKDHFLAQRNIRYMQEKRPRAVVLPYVQAEFYRQTAQAAQRSGTQLYAPDFSREEAGEIQFDGWKLKYFRISHSGREYADVPHYGLLLCFDNLTIWIGGDCDYTNFEQHRPIFQTNIDLAFFNPLFLNHPTGRKIILAANAKQTFIYHLPQIERPMLPMRRQVQIDWERHKEQLQSCPIQILLDPLAKIYSK